MEREIEREGERREKEREREIERGERGREREIERGERGERERERERERESERERERERERVCQQPCSHATMWQITTENTPEAVCVCVCKYIYTGHDIFGTHTDWGMQGWVGYRNTQHWRDVQH